MMVSSTTCKLSVASIVGVVLCIIGSVSVVLWPKIFDNILNHELALSPHSKSYGLWEVTPIPMYIEFFLFNWTNSDDLRKPGTKPILEELGPYTFREHRRKIVHAWNKNDTVTFQQNRTWHFEPSLSNGSLDDLVTTINIPAVSAAFSVRGSTFAQFFLDKAMIGLGTKLVVTKSVREFLFDGYNDPLLDLAKIIPPSFAPSKLPFDKFGWFYSRNGSASYDGMFNMYTGVESIKNFGEVGEWDYQRTTTYYKSFCGMVNGSAGEFFPPKREKTSISLFSPDVCRTLKLNYKEEVEVNGIPGYRYWGDDTMFSNATTIPDNWCFCPSGDCAPNGAIDVSTCKWGAPAFISFPHFYHADPYYREAVEGMDPDVDRHQMFIDVEPRTGIPIQVAAALQINILLQPMKEISLLNGVPKIYFPEVWFKQTARIDEQIRPELKLLTTLPPLGTVVSLVVLSVGVTVILIVSIFFITVKCRKDSETQYLTSHVLGVPQTKKSFMQTLRGNVLAAFRAWKVKIQPESVVTLHNGSRISHHAIIPKNTINNDTKFMNADSRPSNVPMDVNYREELTPLRGDPSF